MNQIRHNNIIYRNGDYVLTKIQDQFIGDAKICITSTGTTYICHNSKYMNGAHAPDRFGYSYSWSFNILRPNTDVILIDNLSLSKKYQKIELGSKLDVYLSTSVITDLYKFIMRKNSLSEYTHREVSLKRGMITLTNEKGRTIDMKIGRFVKLNDIDNELTNVMIENLTNDYISAQEGSKIKIEYLYGRDFLDGYIKENQLCAASLLDSCMNNKPKLLELYAQNPEVISLLVVKNNDKVIGRSIIWNINDNVKFIDKSYVSFEWVNNIIKKEIDNKNYLTVFNELISIKLNKFDMDLYPYLDTFRFFDSVNGILSNQRLDTSDKYLESTSGSYSTLYTK